MAKRKRKKKPETKAERRARIHEEYVANTTRVHMDMADLSVPWVLRRIVHQFVSKGSRGKDWDHETKKYLRDHLRGASKLTRTPAGIPKKAWDLGQELEKEILKRRRRHNGMRKLNPTGGYFPATLPSDARMRRDRHERVKVVLDQAAGWLLRRIAAIGMVEVIGSDKCKLQGDITWIESGQRAQAFMEVSRWRQQALLKLRVPKNYVQNVVKQRIASVEGKIVLQAWGVCVPGEGLYAVRFLDFGADVHSFEIRRGMVRALDNKAPYFVRTDEEVYEG